MEVTLERELNEARAALVAIRIAGERLSNAAFNLGQRAAEGLTGVEPRTLDARTQLSLWEGSRNWDRTITAHRGALRRLGRSQ